MKIVFNIVVVILFYFSTMLKLSLRSYLFLLIHMIFLLYISIEFFICSYIFLFVVKKSVNNFCTSFALEKHLFHVQLGKSNKHVHLLL